MSLAGKNLASGHNAIAAARYRQIAIKDKKVMEKKLFDAISLRKSTRNYTNIDIEKKAIKDIENFTSQIPTLSNFKVNFRIFKNEPGIIDLIHPLSSFLIQAPYFFIVSCRKEKNYLEEAGFQSEHLILYLTSKNLNTCYIGGMIDFIALEKKIHLPDNEKIIIFSPIGKSKDNFFNFFQDLQLKTCMMITGIDLNRKKLNEIVFHNIWENKDIVNIEDKLLEIFSQVQLAPSWCNIQPWRFIVTDSKIYLFMANPNLKDEILGHKNTWDNDYRKFDVGIAMSHFNIAAKYLNFRGNWFFPTEKDYDKLLYLKVPSNIELISVWDKSL